MKHTFPTLYEKSTTGKIKQWTIEVLAPSKTMPTDIITTFGVVDGKLQTTTDTVREGKNLGKDNETTPWEQAFKEAQSKWEKKKKSGYVETFQGASLGQVDAESVAGGIAPMLAKSFDKDGGKIIFPCAGQPKLDGIRCVAVKQGQDVSLFTRTRKPIKSCPHIVREILEVFSGVDSIILDGELYNHKFKADFEQIVSLVRKDQPTPEAEALVQYHIYDVVDQGATFQARSEVLDQYFHKCHDKSPLRIVTTIVVGGEEHAPFFFNGFKKAGYEGMMLRNFDSLYEVDKRSAHLQKVKEFEDAEFEIVGVEEGRGKLQGLVGAFVCKTPGGEIFKAKPAGDQSATAVYLQKPSTVIGRSLTVQFQGLTGKNGVPRFPVGLRIREEGL
jgi:DNA ligase-1